MIVRLFGWLWVLAGAAFAAISFGTAAFLYLPCFVLGALFLLAGRPPRRRYARR